MQTLPVEILFVTYAQNRYLSTSGKIINHRTKFMPEKINELIFSFNENDSNIKAHEGLKLYYKILGTNKAEVINVLEMNHKNVSEINNVIVHKKSNHKILRNITELRHIVAVTIFFLTQDVVRQFVQPHAIILPQLSYIILLMSNKKYNPEDYKDEKRAPRKRIYY